MEELGGRGRGGPEGTVMSTMIPGEKKSHLCSKCVLYNLQCNKSNFFCFNRYVIVSYDLLHTTMLACLLCIKFFILCVINL